MEYTREIKLLLGVWTEAKLKVEPKWQLTEMLEFEFELSVDEVEFAEPFRLSDEDFFSALSPSIYFISQSWQLDLDWVRVNVNVKVKAQIGVHVINSVLDVYKRSPFHLLLSLQLIQSKRIFYNANSNLTSTSSC